MLTEEGRCACHNKEKAYPSVVLTKFSPFSLMLPIVGARCSMHDGVENLSSLITQSLISHLSSSKHSLQILILAHLDFKRRVA